MRIRLYHTYIDNAAATQARLWSSLPSVRAQQLADRPLAARAEGAALSALFHKALIEWETDGDAFCTVDSATLTVPYPTWEIADNGKPFAAGIETPTGAVYPAFSHSHGHVLVVLCDHPCGADIQTWNAPALSPARWARTAAHICHPDDPPTRDRRDVARHFAAKEAALKRDGCGLRRPLASVKLAEQPLTADGQPLFFYETEPSCIIAVSVSER